jgi:putative membrane protein
MDVINWKILVNVAAFALSGIIIFVIAAFVFEWITPFKMWKEIVDNKNVAVAITVGAAFLGIAIIVAAAIHG